MKKTFGILRDRVNIRQEVKKYFLLLLVPVIACFGLYIAIQFMTYRYTTYNASQAVEKLYLQISSMQHEADMTELALQSDFAALNNNMWTSTSENAAESGNNYSSTITTQITIRMQGCTYIKHIYFVDYERERIYSDLGVFTLDSLSGILSSLAIETASLENISEPKWNMSISTHLADPYYICPFHTDGGADAGCFIITIDIRELMDKVFSPATWFFCLYNEDIFLTSQTIRGEVTLTDLNSEKKVSRLLGQAVKCIYMSVDDLTYLVAIPRRDFYYPYIVLGICFAVYVIAIFVFGFVYLYHVSRKRYIEVSGLMDILPQNGEGCAYGDLIPAVRTAMLEASSREKRQLQVINEHVFYNILHSFYTDSEIETHMRELGIPTEQVIYFVVIFTIREVGNIALATTDEKDLQEMPRTIFFVAVDQICPEEMRCYCCSDADSFLVMFYSEQDQDLLEQVQSVSRKLCRFLFTEYGIDTHIAVSSPVTEPQKLPEAFDQAKVLEKFSTAINSTSDLICENLLHENKDVAENNFISQEQLLVNTLLIGKYESVPSVVKMILSEQIAAFSSDYNMAERRLQLITGILVEWLYNLQEQGIKIDADDIERLRKASSIDALNAETERIFSSIRLPETSAENKRKVSEACEYIMLHMNDSGLNVTMICDSVGLIPQRLIPLFQEQFHMGIAEYVNYRRIETAKELLLTTKRTARQIGEDVGYATSDTFVRNFKKRENCTPTEFRKLKASDK